MRRQVPTEPGDVDGHMMGAWRRITLSMALWSGLAACVNLPADVRAELECTATAGADRFGNESCADSAH
jgi:hypothetical protein